MADTFCNLQGGAFSKSFDSYWRGGKAPPYS